jgi:hypothetical protein
LLGSTQIQRTGITPDKENHMNHLKMLGLAVIAALGLMAFVGAGTASATTLATDAAGTINYEVGTEIHSSLKPKTSALLEDTLGNPIATCTESTVKGKLETPAVETNGKKYPSGTWVGGKISALTWGGCSQTTDSISTSEEGGVKYYGSLEIMKTGADEGEVIGKNSKVTLGVFGISCVYGTSPEGTKLGTVKGGSGAELVINAVIPKVEGGFACPSTGRWTATYVLTAPHAVHIVE